jgi:F-type H+-transporting ATPase subunit c
MHITLFFILQLKTNLKFKETTLTMNAQLITELYSSTALIVGIILAAAGFASALGWAMICSKYLEGIARQPEMRPQLMTQMLFTGGLMEAFPMIVLGISMWFIFANPFIGAAETAVKALAGGG